MDSLAGGMVRWRHGRVIKLLATDTFEELDGAWNECCTILNTASHGYDTDRPLLEWSGDAIDRVANAAGL
jgi:hypothetical protein